MNSQITFYRFSKQILGLLLVLLSIAGHAQNSVPKSPTLKGKKILYVYGGWEGHKPKESVDLMVPKLRSEGAIVFLADNLAVYTDDKVMAETDLIIQNWTMGKITPEEYAGLEKAVRNGTGFAGWHGGLGDAFRDNLPYQFMVGGQFLFHPEGEVNYPVKIIDHDDPITAGINDFTLKATEQYYMLIDPNVQVLAISEFGDDQYIANGVENILTGSTMPVVWKKNYGKGRVFYSSIGHNLTDFDIPEVMTLQMRGFRWASEGKYLSKESTISPAYPGHD